MDPILDGVARREHEDGDQRSASRSLRQTSNPSTDADPPSVTSRTIASYGFSGANQIGLVTFASDIDREALLLEPAPDEPSIFSESSTTRIRTRDHLPRPSLRRADEAAMKTSHVVRSRKLLTIAM